jgi:hypothetical protein
VAILAILAIQAIHRYQGDLDYQEGVLLLEEDL